MDKDEAVAKLVYYYNNEEDKDEAYKTIRSEFPEVLSYDDILILLRFHHLVKRPVVVDGIKLFEY